MSNAVEVPLPECWAITSISDVAEVNPKFDKAGVDDDLEVSFVPMPAVEAESGRVDVTATRLFGEVKKGYTGFLEGDVLFAKITPCMENGKMAVVPTLKNNVGFGSTEFHVLRPYQGISPEYLYYCVSSKRVRYDAEHNMTGAVGQKRVPTNYISAKEIPVPPTNEQHRIVAKIETLFSELDKGIEALKIAREQLKVYRQAVLKHAFEGKLTARWRERNKDKLETPEQLLARIQQERQARYQQQLQDWQTAVKVWEKNGKQGKKPVKTKALISQDVLKAEDTNDLPEIPQSWAWFRLNQLSEISGGLTKNQKRNSMPRVMKYLRVANVYSDQLLLDEIYEIGVTEEEAKKILLETGDILVVEGNGSIEQIGRVALWDGSVEGCGHQNHLIRVRLSGFIDSRVVLLFLLSPCGRDFIVKEASSTSGLHTLSISKVGNLMIPIMSGEESSELIQKVDTQTSNIEKLQFEIDEQLFRSETLRQSILKKAFSGQLVPQDLNDEPASTLLERIRAESAGADKSPNKRNFKSRETI